MNSVEVELRPHVGKNYNKKLNAVVEIEHNQWVVMAAVNGGPMMQVGYIGKSEGAPLNGIDTLRALPESVRELIRQKVDEQLGRTDTEMFTPAEPDPRLFGASEEE